MPKSKSKRVLEEEEKRRIRMLDLELLKSEVETRQHIYDKIKPIYQHDLRLLKQAKRRLNIFLGND